MSGLTLSITYTLKGTLLELHEPPKGLRPVIATLNEHEFVFVKARVDTGKIYYVARGEINGEEYTILHSLKGSDIIVWRGDNQTPVGHFESEMKFPYSDAIPILERIEVS
jgi:hypothetical protein